MPCCSADRVFYYNVQTHASSWTHPLEQMHRDTCAQLGSLKAEFISLKIVWKRISYRWSLYAWTCKLQGRGSCPRYKSIVHYRSGEVSKEDSMANSQCAVCFVNRISVRIR